VELAVLVMLDVNVFGALAMMQEAVRVMQGQDDGCRRS